MMSASGAPATANTVDPVGTGGDSVESSSIAVPIDLREALPYYLRVHSGTDTFVAEPTGDSMTQVRLVGEPSSQRREFRGKTLGSWGLDRRRAARELMDLWSEAVSHIDSDGFAVYVEPVIAKAEECMPQFRDIAKEDVFSGVLQLVRNAISGPNFMRLQERRLEGIITNVLSSLRQVTIDMETYISIHNTLYENGLLKKD